MKIRNGFVSNSSSSSFLVISTNSEEYRPTFKYEGVDLNIPEDFGGNTEFGRENVNYTDFGSRLNFALMLAESWDRYEKEQGILELKDNYYYCGRNDPFWNEHKPEDFHNLVKMIRKVVGGALKCKSLNIYLENSWDTTDQKTDYYLNTKKINKKDKEYCYVDHGSSWGEQPGNLKIFESEEMLYNFLFRKGSYVANRGDEYISKRIVPKDGDIVTVALEHTGFTDEEIATNDWMFDGWTGEARNA
jgi:hypothetical protein